MFWYRSYLDEQALTSCTLFGDNRAGLTKEISLATRPLKESILVRREGED